MQQNTMQHTEGRGQMTLETLPIQDIIANPDNPPQRVIENTHGFRALCKSILEWGQIEPITITNDGKVVNGTRRMAALKKAGFETVLANRLPLNESGFNGSLFDQMFLECNVVERLTGAQWAWRYLKGASVPQIHKTKLDFLKKIGGIGCIRRIVDLGKSPVSFYIGLRMFENYTNMRNKKMLKAVIYWMLIVSSSYRLKVLIGEYIPAQLLINAVMEKAPIAMRGNWRTDTITSGSKTAKYLRSTVPKS